jgi:Eukaryotic initiation factor 4E
MTAMVNEEIKGRVAVEEDESDEFLNDIFSLKFHCPNDDNWTYDSYAHLTNISTVKEYWRSFDLIKDKLKSGIFFLMREGVEGAWDHEENINGGVLSIKVLKDDIVDYFEKLSVRMLGENLLIPELQDNWRVINGISTSPKRYFCIVKIWLKTNDYPDKKFFDIPGNFYGDVIYRENMENIQKNHEHEGK